MGLILAPPLTSSVTTDMLLRFSVFSFFIYDPGRVSQGADSEVERCAFEFY